MECTEFCILDTAVRVQNRLKGSLFYLLDRFLFYFYKYIIAWLFHLFVCTDSFILTKIWLHTVIDMSLKRTHFFVLILSSPCCYTSFVMLSIGYHSVFSSFAWFKFWFHMGSWNIVVLQHPISKLSREILLGVTFPLKWYLFC